MRPLLSPLVAVLFLISFSHCIKKDSAPSASRATGDRGAAAADAIVIGEYGPLTGPESSFGQGGHRGMSMAVEEVNATGGVHGRPLKLISYDDEGKADVAVTAVTRLITQDKVVLIVGEQTSTRSIAAGAVAQDYKIPMISPAATNPKVTQVGDYIFRVCFIDPFQGFVMAKFAATDLKLKTAAIFRDLKSDYSVGLADVFRNEFTKLGGQIVAESAYSAGDLDFKSQITSIKAKKPDVLFIPGFYTEVGLIARQARELGFKGTLLGGDGWDGEQLTQIGGTAIAGGYFSNHYANDDKSPVVQNFVTKYKTKYGELPNSSSVTGYDAVMVAADAMKRAASITPKAIRDAIAQTKNFPGVTGSITINEERNAVKSAVILKVAANSAFEFVTTVTP